jgi:hypothetical protein
MYSKIYDFCKVKNLGNCFRNGELPTPRVNFILSLCDQMGIKYELDTFSDDKSNNDNDMTIRDFRYILDTLSSEKKEKALDLYKEFNQKVKDLNTDFEESGLEDDEEAYDFHEEQFYQLEDEYSEKLKAIAGEIKRNVNNYFNIVLTGTSDKFVVAHHDIVNKDSDNANDNSCSVINALMIKKLRPEVNVVILDGEEFGGIGSNHLSQRIKAGDFKCKWVLNLELTGKGGKNFFVGAMGTPLTDWIANRFECPMVNVPFNDSVIFKKYGINSTVINPLPVTEEKSPVINKEGEYLNFKMLFNCHKMSDSVDTIDPKDMEEFVNEICLKIIDEA